MPFTVWRYIGKKYTSTLILSILMVSMIIALFDMVELFRVLPNSVSTLKVIKLSFLKNYSRMERIFPFLIMLSSMVSYTNLTKHFELIILKSSGLSIWKILLPNFIIAFLFGIAMMLFLNPIGTFLYSQYESQKSSINQNGSTPISFTSDGIWLYQQDRSTKSTAVLHAEHIIPDQNTLLKVLIFIMNEDGSFIKRIDSNKALFKKNNWQLEDALITTPTLEQYRVKKYSINSHHTFLNITDKIIDTDSISFLQLIPLIKKIKKAGLPVLKQQMTLSKILISPIFFLVMVMVGACFVPKMERFNKNGLLQFLGVLSGFFIYFTADIFYALGASGNLKIWFAALCPTLLCAIFSSYYLLQKEEG